MILHRHPDLVADVSRSLWYRGWCEDMDIAKDDSLKMIGRRAGLLQEDVDECLEVSK